MNKSALGFTLISGFGWLIDLATMTSLVHVNIQPGIANFISATVAATFVYWTSRVLVFRISSNTSNAFWAFAVYIVYTLVTVIFFSFLIQYTSTLLYGFLEAQNHLQSMTLVAFVVKVFYTPFNLALNYIISSKLAFLTQ